MTIAKKILIKLESMGHGFPTDGDFVEDCDLTVVAADKSAFDDVLNKYLKKVDPDNELSIRDAVNKMSQSTRKNLIDELMDFSYDN